MNWRSASAARAALTALFALVAAVLGLRYIPYVSGDAMIHLSIMENSAGGEWFAFNAGLHDASSTSMLWTVLGATLFRIGGGEFVVVSLKVVGFACWLVNGLLVYLNSRLLGVSRETALLIAALICAIPGTLMNSLQGMENAMFATSVLAAVWLLGSQLKLNAADMSATAGLFVLCGLSMSIRPEGFISTAVIGLVWVHHIWTRHRRRFSGLLLLALTCGAMVLLPLWLLYYSKTGQVVPSSGVSRLMMARRTESALSLGPLWVYHKVLLRLAIYLPLTLAAAWGLRALARQRFALVLGVICAAGIALYTFGTGAVHTSRYMIWLFALLGILAAAGVHQLEQRSERRVSWVLAIAALWMLALVVTEGGVRMTRSGGTLVSDLDDARTARTERTDELLERICRLGCCVDIARPGVAYVEVQQRYSLDDRVWIASVDGCTLGPFQRPVEFLADGCPNLDNLERDHSIVAIGENPRGSNSNLLDCKASDWANRAAAHWDLPEAPEIPGWQWDDGMLVRDCRASEDAAKDT